MTFAKASALAAGFVGAMALGVFIGPSITTRTQSATDTASVQAPAQTPAEAPSEAKPPSRKRAINVPKATARPAAIRSTPAVDMSSPEFHKVFRQVLNPGADISIASSGFKDAEQFAVVAHVAQDTKVPFMLLKHRVLEQKMSLGSAIRESKPDVDTATAVNRARAEAQHDLATFAG
jgi:hypothetical protein